MADSTGSFNERNVCVAEMTERVGESRLDRSLLPLCVAGENACPPEDVSGPHGYAEFPVTKPNALHPEHASMLRWAGGAFDPRDLDLNRINRELRFIVRRGHVQAHAERIDDGVHAFVPETLRPAGVEVVGGRMIQRRDGECTGRAPRWRRAGRPRGASAHLNSVGFD